MTDLKKLALRFSLAALAVMGICVLSLAWWLPTGEELAERVTAEASERLGVAVSIGTVHWALLPTPAVTIRDFRTHQAQPVVVGKLSVFPNMYMLLLQRKLALKHMDVDDAVIPRNSFHALMAKPNTLREYTGDGVPLERLEFRNLTWISYSGIATTFDGEIDFAPHWRPRHAALRRPGHTPPFTLTLSREADTDRWQTHIEVGGGTAHGNVELKTDKDGATMHLRGQLAPRSIEVASALATFNRRSPVAGQASGPTELWAEGKSLSQLTRSLHTQTRFTVNPATVLRFDLDKAISTRAKEHADQTALQELTGQLDTQNGAEGMRVTLTDVRARAGKFTATGKGTIYHGQIEASGNLDLVEGALGIPITLSGPVKKPKVTVPPGFYAGAAIGTVLLPGIGTAIGARIGGAIGEVFKGDEKKPATK